LNFSKRTNQVIASTGLALALSACAGQALSLQPTTQPPAAPTVSSPTAAAAPVVPSALANYPAPTNEAEPSTSAAYPAPVGSTTPAYPAPSALPATELAAPTIEAQSTAIPAPAAAPSCLPPDEPLVPASQTPPAATPPISRTLQSMIPRYGYRVVNTYPHDRGAYTEGLQYVDGALYEGTGRKGASELRRVVLETGEMQQRCTLPDVYFGEGVTVLGDKIYQLTWQNHIGFVYDKTSFTLQRSFTYPSEGWGLTHDGQRLIMSDGTATIHFLDPATLEETGHIDVHDDLGPVIRLNELEYVRGEIYANIWQTDWIVRIDPQTGTVLGWIDLGGLLSAEDRLQTVGELNGIAYDAAHDRLFVTGKLWPKIFEIQLVPVG
jgi:glutaminyl-peptide cyclotransferase